MAHLMIEYSANLERDIDPQGLVDVAHIAMTEAGPFPVGGLRTRAARREQYAIADQHADNGFVHMTLTMGSGRDDATRKAAGDHVFSAVSDYLRPVLDALPVALSLYMFESDPTLSWKENSVHDAISARKATRDA